MKRCTAIILFCSLWGLMTLPAYGQVKPVDSKLDEDELPKIANHKKRAKEAAEVTHKQIKKVILDQPSLEPEKKTKLAEAQDASLDLHSVILDAQEDVAKEWVQFQQAQDPQTRADVKAAIIGKLKYVEDTRQKKDEIDGVILTYVPKGVDVTPKDQELPPLIRPMPRLVLPKADELATFQKVKAIHETLQELKAASIEADTSPGTDPLQATTRTELLLQQLDSQYTAAAPDDTRTQLAGLRKQEQSQLDEIHRHDATVLEHNSRLRQPPTAPNVPRTVLTVEEQRYWQGIINDYNAELQNYENWRIPYNQEADRLDATTARLESELQKIRDRIQWLRQER